MGEQYWYNIEVDIYKMMITSAAFFQNSYYNITPWPKPPGDNLYCKICPDIDFDLGTILKLCILLQNRTLVAV